MNPLTVSIPLSAAPQIIDVMGVFIRVDLGVVRVGNEFDFVNVTATVIGDDELALVEIQLDDTHDIWSMDNAIDAARDELAGLGAEMGEPLEDNATPAGAADFELVKRA